MRVHICTMFHRVFQTYASLKSLCSHHMHKQIFIYFSNLSSGEMWAGQACSEQRTCVVKIKIHSTTSIAGCTFSGILTTILGLCKSVSTLKQEHWEVQALKFCNNEAGAFKGFFFPDSFFSQRVFTFSITSFIPSPNVVFEESFSITRRVRSLAHDKIFMQSMNRVICLERYIGDDTVN